MKKALIFLFSFTVFVVEAQLYSSGNNSITGSKVGIGTNAPLSSLHVKAPTYSVPYTHPPVSPFQVDYYSNCTNCMGIHKTALFVSWDGLIGINTNTPAVGFDINASIRGGASAGALKLQTDYGYFVFGAQNAGFMHFLTDLPRFYFNKRLEIDEGIISTYNDDLILQTERTNRLSILKSDGSATFNTHWVNFIGILSSTPTIKFDALTGIGYMKQLKVGNETILYNSTHGDAVATFDGKTVAREMIVTQTNWADFVFDENYKLKPINELETFIEENKHLPDVPTEAEVKENGINTGQMDAILLQK
ncbi:MAG: hypothetical protein LRY27_00325 [Chitinophagales bacterium]|nr:hypothetical protein [Chitinophagales bacterium]